MVQGRSTLSPNSSSTFCSFHSKLLFLLFDGVLLWLIKLLSENSRPASKLFFFCCFHGFSNWRLGLSWPVEPCKNGKKIALLSFRFQLFGNLDSKFWGLWASKPCSHADNNRKFLRFSWYLPSLFEENSEYHFVEKSVENNTKCCHYCHSVVEVYEK